MKENKYDNEQFFEQYSRFPRSVEGLSAAGEWHEFKRMLPDLKDKRVLDIGCGFGWHCIYSAQEGAKKVIGLDISEKMLTVAREKTAFKQVEYLCVPMEDTDFEKDSFDVVISSLALHYTSDFKLICEKVWNFLVTGGHFVFSVEHPIFTAEGSQQWFKTGDKTYWPVDNYFLEGRREAVFLGEQVIKYHKTLTTYLNTLLKAGLVLEEIVEPKPQEHLLKTVEGMKDELRRPMMLLVSARKK